MAEKTPIVINDNEYTEDQLAEQQKAIINHNAVSDRKIKSAQFNLDQLTVGRDAFMNLLTNSLNEGETA